MLPGGEAWPDRESRGRVERAGGAPDAPELPVRAAAAAARRDESPGPSVAALENKMAEYMACGTTLAWLIDPANRRVLVYRQGSDVEELDSPMSISGDPPLEGFRLKLAEIWERL